MQLPWVSLVLGATLAAATPVHMDLHKRAITWDVVTDIVYVTVTEGVPPTTYLKPSPLAAALHTVHSDSTDGSTTTTAISSSTFTPPQATPQAHTTSSSTAIPSPPAPLVADAPRARATSDTEVATVVAPSKSAVAQASSSSAPAPAASPSDFVSSALYYHNQHRSNHSSPDISWNQTLADWASNTASACVFQHDMSQGTGNYGQNINAAGSSNPVDDWDPAKVVASSIVNDWYYSEYLNFAPYYDNPSPPSTTSTPEYLHFSQIVWKDTLDVGCASLYCGKNSVLGSPGNDYYGWYTVCNYFPVGNMQGSFDTEVTKPIGTIDKSIKAPQPSS